MLGVARESVSNHWWPLSLKSSEEAEGIVIAVDYFSLVGKKAEASKEQTSWCRPNI